MPRGKKQCPQCNALVGPRLRVCECGHEFTFKPGKAPKAKQKRIAEIPQVEKPFEALTENPSETVGIKDRESLRSFIEQLQTCSANSDGTGGCYSAFLHHEHGTLEVQVWFPMVLKGSLKG